MKHSKNTTKPQRFPTAICCSEKNCNLSQTQLVERSISDSSQANVLSEADILELDSLEATVQSGFQAFWSMGAALRQIRDKRLYRVKHDTFEEYCIQRWEISRRTAYQLIDAAAVYENVRHGAQILPANERQARPLTALTAEEQQKVWHSAVSTAPNGKMTATHVVKVVKEYQERNGSSPSRKRNNFKQAQKLSQDDAREGQYLRSCWNCCYCSPESLEEKDNFYCLKFGKLSFLEKDGETRAKECSYWIKRLKRIGEAELERVPTPSTIALTLHIPAHLQQLMQDMAKVSGENVMEWATRMLTEVVNANYPGYKINVN